MLQTGWEESSSDSFSLSAHCDTLQGMWPSSASTSMKFVPFVTYTRAVAGGSRIVTSFIIYLLLF